MIIQIYTRTPSLAHYLRQLENLKIHIGWREYLTAPGIFYRL